MWLQGQLEDGAEDVCQLNSAAPPIPSGLGLFLSLTPCKNFETLSCSVLVMFRGKSHIFKNRHLLDIETIPKDIQFIRKVQISFTIQGWSLSSPGIFSPCAPCLRCQLSWSLLQVFQCSAPHVSLFVFFGQGLCLVFVFTGCPPRVPSLPSFIKDHVRDIDKVPSSPVW